MRDSNQLTLPHRKTIKSICTALLTDLTLEEKQISLTYAKHLLKLLDDNDKYATLLIDEIHHIHYKGGNICEILLLCS